MAAHALADTLPVSLAPSRGDSGGARSSASSSSGSAATAHSFESSSSSQSLASAAEFLRARLRRRHKGLLVPGDIVRDVAQRAGRLAGSPQAAGQHVYQEALYLSENAQAGVEWTAVTLQAGWYRLGLGVPSRLRLLRWQAKRALARVDEAQLIPFSRGRSRRLVRRVLPLLLVLLATAACGIVSKDGSGDGAGGLAIAPPLSKSKAAEETEGKTVRDAPWSYVLPVDHGIRADRSGQGHFRAPRFHGEHNGLDLLAPVGTPVFSPCKGQAMAGVSRSFGRWVHIICPVPDAYMKAGGPRPWASFFYAHLDNTKLPHNKWVSIAGTQQVGAVGKSGNARGPNVQPHLHLELIVQKNRRHAMDERHLGSDQSQVPAATHFAESLSSECMAPYGFQPKSQLLQRARRIDPFVALTCLSEKKPNFQKAPDPLSSASHAWTQFYVAKDFNVNLGVEDSRLATR